MVQDLQGIYEAAIPSYPVEPNSYTILIQIPHDTTWFTILDLKEAFFCTPYHPDSQVLFAFEWTGTTTNVTQQFTWTILPQAFRDSSHLFGNTVARELRELALNSGAVL